MLKKIVTWLQVLLFVGKHNFSRLYDREIFQFIFVQPWDYTCRPKNAAEYIPKGTFIHALDFQPQEIGTSEEKYTSYPKEKNKYYDAGEAEIVNDAIGQLCHN